jgi:hypothetical protein
MKDELAERLLALIMRWSAEDIARERPNLQALALHKYNGYEQFSPGMHFLENLALWLAQFKSMEDKLLAYTLVKSRLLFVSSAEMAHLVSIAFPDLIRHMLIKTVAQQIKINYWNVSKIERSPEYRLLLRQSLFLGLSDGSHVDIFRRANTNLSTEQIFRAHELTKERATDMLSALQEDGKSIVGRPLNESETHFRMVFLLDDFSASGISYMREENGSYKGKVARFQKDLFSPESGISKIINPDDLTVCLVLYVATEKAKSNLEKIGPALFRSIPFRMITVQSIPSSVSDSIRNDKEIISLLKRYYDSKIETKSYRKGKCEEPYLGFDECALPLVLYHNTPNNSIPLLWFPEDLKVRGLFPRVSRFSD